MNGTRNIGGPLLSGPLGPGNAGREGGGGSRGGGRVTSTLKQEDWNKRLAWPRTQKGKSPKRTGGGKGTEKKPVGAGLRLLDAGYRAQSPASRAPSSIVSDGPNPLSRSPAFVVPLCSRRFFHFNVLFSSLHLPLYPPPPPLSLCSLTSTPSASVSPTVRTSFVSTSRSFVLDSPVDVICDLTSRNMQRGQLVTARRTGKLILLSLYVDYIPGKVARELTRVYRIPFKR